MPGQVNGNLEVKPPVAENLRVAQAAAFLSNRELAHAVGVSERLLGKWRSGTITPSWPKLTALGEVLGREPSWFYADHDAEAEEAA
jgi:transcriptional regulator with XRE-family HTH domain